MGLIPGWRTKIPQAHCVANKKIKLNKNTLKKQHPIKTQIPWVKLDLEFSTWFPETYCSNNQLFLDIL